MKIALASAPVKNRDVAFNLQAMVEIMARWAGKADLIVFGETALQGFGCLCWDYEVDRQMAVDLTGEPVRRLQAAAKEHAVAVCFGLIEGAEDGLYSSQIFIGADGAIVHRFRRVSRGWKEYWRTDDHYREGKEFARFSYQGVSFAIGLCGDLWTEGRWEEMAALGPEVVLWPVWCDYPAGDWNGRIKYEYAGQAALCGKNVLLVNPFCADPGVSDLAAGGAAWFREGKILAEAAAGAAGALLVEV